MLIWEFTMYKLRQDLKFKQRAFKALWFVDSKF